MKTNTTDNQYLTIAETDLLLYLQKNGIQNQRILSEETGMISVAEGGELQRNFTPKTLAKTLEDRMLWERENTFDLSKKRLFRKNKKQTVGGRDE